MAEGDDAVAAAHTGVGHGAEHVPAQTDADAGRWPIAAFLEAEEDFEPPRC